MADPIALPDRIHHSCDEGGIQGCNVNGLVDINDEGAHWLFAADVQDLHDADGKSAWDVGDEDDLGDEDLEVACSDARERFAREMSRRWNAHADLARTGTSVLAVLDALLADMPTRGMLAAVCVMAGVDFEDGLLLNVEGLRTATAQASAIGQNVDVTG